MAGRVGGTPVSSRLRAPHPTRLCAVFAIRDGATSAAIYDVTVAGYAGTPIEPAAASFTLTNEEFNALGADVSAWFTNLPPGLTAATLHGIPDGSSDAIATDHAPHTARDKLAGAPGFPGLETAYAACNTALVASRRASASRLSALMSANPARILGLDRGAFPKGRLSPGFAADVVLVDPAERWTVDAAGFRTKGKGSPFAGKTLTGRVKAVFRRGVLL
ncbi:amidohydrolase family protein [Treponema endosymbiont of Eucomonympha sp.]|uniref:amidohydrolase family protein n=1 Tax=Treponema endosymbiont of Eucomonympha sp. TaxID=1580831 RepID=UPI0007516AF1|nr:amidohydrolase family protein [Treponema endosymbiont of Eucomonympha sp.]